MSDFETNDTEKQELNNYEIQDSIKKLLNIQNYNNRCDFEYLISFYTKFLNKRSGRCKKET